VTAIRSTMTPSPRSLDGRSCVPACRFRPARAARYGSGRVAHGRTAHRGGGATACLAAACTNGPDGDGDGGSSTEGRVTASVVEVVDGDTIRVDLSGSATLIRLIGIDAPETDGPFTERECFDRTLAYVWVDGSLFNERLVREGSATVATFPPNGRYVDRLAAAEPEARRERRGLWRACRVSAARYLNRPGERVRSPRPTLRRLAVRDLREPDWPSEEPLRSARVEHRPARAEGVPAAGARTG
jgi:endonuclease YncB( thermonuclease family)